MIAIILILLFAAVTVISHIVISVGICLVRRKENRAEEILSSPEELPFSVSVVVPAKNEEANLPRLFTSLKKLKNQEFEIIFINDRSEDGTAGLLADFRSELAGRVHIVTITDHPENTGMNPKQYALSKGIEAARGDILLFTDADCEVPQNWIARMTAQYADPGVGLCIGPIQSRPDRGFLPKYQHFDHIFRYGYTAGSIGFGMPTGGFGNNLSVRRRALDDIGGYGEIGYSVTEDAALIAAVRDRTEYTIRACISRESLVTALPQTGWKAYSVQERRWSYGAFRSPDVSTVFGYAAVMIFLFAGLAAIPLAFLYRPFFILIISTFSSMLMTAVTGGLQLRAKFKDYWLFLLPCIFYSSLFYTINNLFALFNAPVNWKGKDLDKM